MTGAPLLGYKRMQFNIFLKKEPKITLMKTLNEEEKLVPLFWVEEVKKFKNCIFLAIVKNTFPVSIFLVIIRLNIHMNDLLSINNIFSILF